MNKCIIPDRNIVENLGSPGASCEVEKTRVARGCRGSGAVWVWLGFHVRNPKYCHGWLSRGIPEVCQANIWRQVWWLGLGLEKLRGSFKGCG